MSAATMPACLLRTAADDREEAARDCRKAGTFPEGVEGCTVCAPALSAILRREADFVYLAAEKADLGDAEAYTPSQAAWQAACAAASPPTAYTLAQRADLLQAARILVRVALEVAG